MFREPPNPDHNPKLFGFRLSDYVTSRGRFGLPGVSPKAADSQSEGLTIQLAWG